MRARSLPRCWPGLMHRRARLCSNTQATTASTKHAFSWRCAQGGRAALALAAVQGDLEEAPEVAECLLAFLFHYLLADDRITCLSQGALGHCTVQCPSTRALG